MDMGIFVFYSLPTSTQKMLLAPHVLLVVLFLFEGGLTN